MQPTNTIFKPTQLQLVSSMNQNFMEELNLLLGSVNADCL